MNFQEITLRFIMVSILCLGYAHGSLDFKGLVEKGKQYGMPFPPHDAPLVLARSASSVSGSTSDAPRTSRYTPAFIIEDRGSGKELKILSGYQTQLIRTDRDPLTLPFTTSPPARKGFVFSFGQYSLICAIQCAERGDIKNAELLWTQFEKDYMALQKSDGSLADDPPTMEQAKRILAKSLVTHHWSSVHHSTDTWENTFQSLNQIFSDFPELKHAQIGEILAQLELTLNAPDPPEDSVEHHLLQWAKQPVRIWGPQLFDQDATSSSAVREIVLRGSSALPELERLSTDNRITKHTRDIGFRGRYHWFTLGELADETKTLILGGQKSRGKLPDDEFFLSAAFAMTDNKITNIYEGPAFIISRNHPEKLDALCEQFFQFASSKTSSSYLADAIVTSPLPLAEQTRLLAKYASKDNIHQRLSFLQTLCKQDPQKGAEILLKVISEMPRDSTTAYFYCPYAALTHSVMQVDSVEVWQSYLVKARHCAVGLRMEILNPMNYHYIKGKNRALRLGFLAEFLEDAETRTSSHPNPKWDGPHAGFHFKTISVQNFAALNIASLLEIKAFPDETWTENQWLELRNKVIAALQHEPIVKLK